MGNPGELGRLQGGCLYPDDIWILIFDISLVQATMGLPKGRGLMHRHLLKRSLLTAALIIALALSATGLLDRGLGLCGLGYLGRVNDRYLEAAFQKSMSGFMLLSSVKSGLAVVEGSSVGVGFNLELGDVIQPVYDYVDMAWKAALAGGSILVGMQLALKGLGLVDHWVLAAGLFFALLQVLAAFCLPGWRRLQDGLSEAVRFGATTSVALYLLLPLSVTAAAALSNQITRPMLEAAQEELRQIDAQIRPRHLNQDVLADMAEEGLSGPSLKTRLTDTAAGIKMLIGFLKTRTEKVAALAFRLIAAYVFDCVLFPLFFGLVFMTMLRSGVRYFFEIERRPGPPVPASG
jgi:hypothetical protein